MKILVVCSGNKNRVSPFIQDQVESLQRQGLEVEIFLIKGNGVIGYSRNLTSLKERIRSFNPDIVHAHYGLSGLLACFQRRKPVFITIHGSDVSIRWVRFLSQIATYLSRRTIVVSEALREKLWIKKAQIIPCGVDTSIFKPRIKKDCRDKLGISNKKRLILFSSSFENKVKNYPLAQTTLSLIKTVEKIEIIELKGFTREQVSLLMNAVDVCLMTSYSEGSPQFIKEAMACNCPIVSVDVGDVKENISDIDGCFITSYNPVDIAEKIQLAIAFSQSVGKTNARERLIEKGFDIDVIANKIIDQYNLTLKQ